MGGFFKSTPARRVVLAALAALVCALAAPALAAAASTLVVAPGAAREVEPCATATPCNYLWTIKNASSGDTVQFASGVFAFDGTTLKTNVVVPAGVTLAPAPGDATRPVIRQTTPYKAGFSGPMFALEANVTIRDLEIDQSATTVNNGAGAVDANQGDVIERTILTGTLGGMYATPNAPGTIAMRNDLVIAGKGVAIQLEDGTMSLDNVTAIASGSESNSGIAVLSHSTFSKTSTIEATNTIARGQRYDAQASVESSGSGSTVTLHYSDARTAFELAQGSPAKVDDTDHPTHGEPVFAAAGDYHEVLGSPTIDAGKPDPASGSSDLDGSVRTFGAGTDIGAYELQKLVAPVLVSSPPPVPIVLPAVLPAPLLTGLTLSAARFRVAARGATISRRRAPIGTTIAYSDSEAAVTTFTIGKPVAGVRHGRSCVAPPHKRLAGHKYKPCVRYLALGSFTHQDAAGANRLHFSGRLHGRRLPPRSYRLTAVPRNAAGQSGQPVAAAFTIIA